MSTVPVLTKCRNQVVSRSASKSSVTKSGHSQPYPSRLSPPLSPLFANNKTNSNYFYFLIVLSTFHLFDRPLIISAQRCSLTLSFHSFSRLWYMAKLAMNAQRSPVMVSLGRTINTIGFMTSDILLFQARQLQNPLQTIQEIEQLLMERGGMIGLFAITPGIPLGGRFCR